MAPNSPEEQFILAANDWDLERLYKDLADAKLKVAPHKREFTEVEKRHLRGLLCGCSPRDIAKKLQKNYPGLRTDLSNTVYMYVKQLTHGKVEDIKIKDSRCIIAWLEKAGYKTRSSNSVENKPETRPSVSESDIDDLLERVRSNSPLCAEDFNKLGIKKAEEGDFERTLENFDRAIKLNSKYADAYNNRASIRHELRDYAGAIEDCTEAILLNPNCAVYHNNLGIISYSSDDDRGARADHTRAIKVNAGDAQAYNNRGFARLRLGDLQGALKDFTQAIELNSNDALDDYTQAPRLNPKTFYYLGVIHSRLGNKKKALENFTKAIELKRDFAEAYQNRGIVNYELRYYQRADVDFYNAKNLYFVHGEEENYQKLLDIIEELQEED